MQLTRAVVVGLVALGIAGCASMKHGAQGTFAGDSMQLVKVVSDPAGAKFWVWDVAKKFSGEGTTIEGGTPFMLPKNGEYMLRVQKAGYRLYQEPIKRIPDPAVYANALFPPAFFVDAALGQLHKLPDTITVTLVRE